MSTGELEEAVVDGPSWSARGLGLKSGRYPLAVEAPVLSMVDTLVPGVSTLTTFARYYSLYWSIAALAEEQGLGRDDCRRVVRRAEAAMAVLSLANDGAQWRAHGGDRVLGVCDLSDFEEVVREYSPRSWGFWSQYNGPSISIGTTAFDSGALRSGRHACPARVRAMFGPLHDIAGKDSVSIHAVEELGQLAMHEENTPDVAPLRELFAAVPAPGDPDVRTSDDRTRRATLRLVARAAQLHPDISRHSYADAFRQAIAYGAGIEQDRVLAEIEQAPAWRGVLLRNHSVGAWRRWWADLVAHVRDRQLATRDDLHEWITAALPPGSVAEFEAGLPQVVDEHGHPRPAEDQARRDLAGPRLELATLLLGARRLDTLSLKEKAGFLGRGKRQFLDPNWVAARAREHRSRPVAELGRALVDDMLAQSRRVALRKVKVDEDGEMTLFARLHERNGVYFAQAAEGRGSVGLRIVQLAELAHQLDLFSATGHVTAAGEELLDVRG